MGQGDSATVAAPPRFATGKPTTSSVPSRGESKLSSSEVKLDSKTSKYENKVETSKTEVKKLTGLPGRTMLTSQHLRRPPGGGGSSSSDERGGRLGRGDSISPARSATGTSSSSSRSPSPSPARTTNGHAHHSDHETGTGGGHIPVGIGVASVLGLRRPGSASSRSLSTSSTESEPPRRWPPGKNMSTSSSATTTSDTTASSRIPSRPDSLKSDLDFELRRLRPEKPMKPEGLERKMSAHEQHQELIARHKNWFQAFSKNRSPVSSPVKPDSRPESPNKSEMRPISPAKGEDLRPMSPSKSDLRSPQPSKYEHSRSLHSPTSSTEGKEERKEEDYKEKEDSGEEALAKDEEGRNLDDQDAWSSVLQTRYGPRAKDILSPRGRAEGETSSDWRRERAAILSGRTGQRHSSSEDETTVQVKSHTRVTEASFRFEDTATLQSSWAPPPNYNQTEISTPRETFRDTTTANLASRETTTTTTTSTVVKTLKEEINNAETERTKNVSRQQASVRENGNTHDSCGGGVVGGVGGVGVTTTITSSTRTENESVVSLVERKEKADLIVSESVIIKDSTKEKDIEKRCDDESLIKSDLSGVYLSSVSKREDLRSPRKPGSSKETSEEVNLKLKESIAGHAVEDLSSSSSTERKESRLDYEERIAKRKEEDKLGRREEDRLGRKEEVTETRVRENVSESRRREEITERRRREEIVDRRKREDASDSWREEVGEHRRRREKRDDSVRGKEKSEEHRLDLSYRERSEERIRQIRREREARSRERREESHEKLDFKSDNETSECVIVSTANSFPTESSPLPTSVVNAPHDDKVSKASTTHHHHHHHHRTDTHASTYEPRSFVSHARIPATTTTSSSASSSAPKSTTTTTTTDPTPCTDPKTLPLETTASPSEAETTAVQALEVEEGGGGEVVETVVIGGVLSALKAETVYVSSTEDLSQNDDSKRETKLDIFQVDTSEGDQKEKEDKGREKEENEAKEEEEKKEVKEEEEKDDLDHQDASTRRQLFPDLVAECQQDLERVLASESFRKEAEEGNEPENLERIPPPDVPTSPRTQSLAALDALIHGKAAEEGNLELQETYPVATATTVLDQVEEEEEIVYDHTVTSAQHKIQFCTTPVTVEGIAPDGESHDTDPEPLPPPIPPHAVDPEIMTADEAQRLLSAKESQSILSDEEAQEVVLLLSPQDEDSSKVPPPPVPPHHGEDLPSVPPHYDIPPAVPPHYADMAPPVPPHYTPSEDEFDTRVASHFDPTLASPLSPEDEPSEADSSEASGDTCQVSRVKEVLVEDGVHYLEDGHFWVEVPGLPEDDDEEDNDPMLPFHPHTKLSFSKNPIQVFSTYSVTEYDRKNDEVDPVAASAEYELEKRVEKMDLFPVEIIKGEGGLGLSIIGMGVGADAGVEKLGIFVKTITPGGATERDGRIQVNDQIIEVDGKSLVGVTQVFAASVLKNTSGRVHFLIGREKDPENSEVAILIKQSLQADRERDERRRALGGPDYDPRNGHSIFDPLSSPSEENSRSEEASAPQNYSSYLEGGSSPTSPDVVSPPIESFDLEGDTSDTSPENDVTAMKLKLKESQYRYAVAEAEITKLKMSLLEMEKVVTENVQYTSQLSEAQNRMAEMDEKLQSKHSEVSTYQDMLEQSQGQFIILEKKYYKAKKIIKEYQGRERDFLHREEYHITQLEEKDSHYNALVKALKDRVINLEEELKNAQAKAGLPIQVPSDPDVQPAFLDLQLSAQSALAKQPPRKPSLCTLDPEISDTETDNGASEGDKANTVERKIPVKEELDEAVPPHELLDVSASRAKGELAARGGLANRHLPSLKKTTSMSSAGSQEHSLDDSSLDDELPESQKHATTAVETTLLDTQQEQGSRREVHSDVSQRNDREASPSKRSPTSLMEDVRQAVLQADVSSHVVSTGHVAQQVNSPNRSQTSGFYSVGGRDSIRDSSAGSQSPKLGRSSIHASPMSGVSANPAGVVLLSQRPLDSSLPVHKLGPGVDGSSGDLSSGPASLGSGDEGSGASLGSQTSLSYTHPPTDRSKRSHMWQTAPVVDWTKEQVSQWLIVQGLESCVGRFQDIGMTGPRLLNLDVRDLKSLGLPADEKSKLKRKVKELRLAVEKERKQVEKEKKERERLQKKAEKLAEKAEKKKK